MGVFAAHRQCLRHSRASLIDVALIGQDRAKVCERGGVVVQPSQCSTHGSTRRVAHAVALIEESVGRSKLPKKKAAQSMAFPSQQQRGDVIARLAGLLQFLHQR
jgi:hypothetical protein